MLEKMKIIQRNYRYEGKDYEATITYKRIKNLILRLGKDGRLRISAPLLSSLKGIDEFVSSFLPKLLKRQKKRENPPYDGNDLYLLGEKVEIGAKTEEEIDEILLKKAKEIYPSRLRYYEQMMGVSPSYRLRIRKMKSRYGVNSKKTHSITLQTQLVSYSLPIIDSVIVHELAHHFVFNHSSAFYAVVYRYCPNYNSLRKKLIHHEYH